MKTGMGVGTLHILSEQGYDRGGHHTTKVDHMFILGWGHRTKFQTSAVGRVGGWVGSQDMVRIMPLRGSILQDRTYKILS